MAITAACFAAAGAARAASYDAIVSRDAACNDAFWAGVDALGNDDLKGADAAFGKAVAADRGCFLAYLLLSQVAYARGNEDASAAWLRKAPPEPPEVEAAYDGIRAPLAAHDWPAVERKAQSIIAAYPQTMTALAALHLLGRAQYYGGKKEEALLTLKTAYMYSDLAPGTVPAYASEAEVVELQTFAGRR
jgi:hypothetical protein